MNGKVWKPTNLKLKEHLCKDRKMNRVTIAFGSYYKLLSLMGDLDHAFLTQRQEYSEDE